MKADATNEKGRGAGIFHLIVRILTLPPIVIGITVLLMYAPAKLMTLLTQCHKLCGGIHQKHCYTDDDGW